MIIVSELQMQGDKHVAVNNGLIRILRLAYPIDKLEVVCDDKHANNLASKIVTCDNLKFERIFSYKENEIRKILIIKKTFREVVLACQIFYRAKKNKSKLIVFLSVSPFTAPFINLLAGLSQQKTIVCLHGDIGVLSLNKNKLSTRIYRWVIKYFLRTRNENFTTILFYGEVIRRRLFELFPFYRSENTIAIDHPYEFIVPKLTGLRSKPLIIANIGTALAIKNSQCFYDVAYRSQQHILDGDLRFLQIGHVSNEIKKYSNQYVNSPFDNSGFLSPELFESSLNEANYFIYFFKDGGYYDLCPSGTFFDAIKYQKPIISLRNSFFEYYFEKFGNIGFLCDSLEEMCELLTNLVRSEKLIQEYSEQVSNLKEAQHKMSVELIADDFISQKSNI